MDKAIRFHLDEHMDPDIAKALRRVGIDVTTTVEEQLRERDDDQQWSFILQQKRVIVTDDVGFLARAAISTDHPGVAFCHRSRHSLGEIIRFLKLLHGVFEAGDMIGRVEYL